MAETKIVISGDIHISSGSRHKRSKEETKLWKGLVNGDREAFLKLRDKYGPVSIGL